jgi:hypothetical protein
MRLSLSDIGRAFSKIGHIIERTYLTIRIFDTNIAYQAINSSGTTLANSVEVKDYKKGESYGNSMAGSSIQYKDAH